MARVDSIAQPGKKCEEFSKSVFVGTLYVLFYSAEYGVKNCEVVIN